MPWNDWQIREQDIVIDKRADGSDWELGSGAFGKASLLCLQASRAQLQASHAELLE